MNSQNKKYNLLFERNDKSRQRLIVLISDENGWVFLAIDSALEWNIFLSGLVRRQHPWLSERPLATDNRTLQDVLETGCVARSVSLIGRILGIARKVAAIAEPSSLCKRAVESTV